MVELSLAMSVPAPVIAISDEELVLDKKFVDGMNSHVCKWDGPIDCFMRRGASDIPFGGRYFVRDLDFKIRIMAEKEPPPMKELERYDIAMLSGDNDHDILTKDVIRSLNCPIVYTVEYTHGTRQAINYLETESVPKKLVRAGRIGLKEWKRRQAFSASAGIQLNGYPAFNAYRRLSSSPIIYLDNRATPDLMATREDMDRRRQRLLLGKPLRLYHSGRLERMKGAHHLVPLAAALREAEIPFSLDIYGTGRLHDAMASAIAALALTDVVHLHGPLDYRTELVPLLRSDADVFVSCHLQSDPSCTYLETLACGVPIIGYNNQMWSRLSAESGGGWDVPAGNIASMVREIRRLNQSRIEVVQASQKGLNFARHHDFDNQFSKRMEHLAKIAGGLRRVRFL